MEFKVGDRVEVYFGDDKCEGIIKKIRPNDGICEVSLNGYNTLLVTAIDDISRITKEKKIITLEQLEQRIEKLEKEVFKPVVEHDKPKGKSLLTEDERVILRSMNKDFKWIFRDIFNNLIIQKKKPKRVKHRNNEFVLEGVYVPLYCYKHLFKFIKFEDDEPYNIEELLKGECGNE